MSSYELQLLNQEGSDELDL